MVTKTVGNYTLKTVSNAEMNELSSLILNGCENADPKLVERYFHSWKLKSYTGKISIYYFPKERYFVSRLGEENYAVAMLRYSGFLKC